MKRLIWLLTLIWFLVASHIQLIHAEDMRNMKMHGNHIIHGNFESIFCDKSNTQESQCTKEIFPDKIAEKKQKDDLIVRITNDFYIDFLLVNHFTGENIKIWENITEIPIFYKSTYHNMTWIIRNLN